VSAAPGQGARVAERRSTEIAAKLAELERTDDGDWSVPDQARRDVQRSNWAVTFSTPSATYVTLKQRCCAHRAE